MKIEFELGEDDFLTHLLFTASESEHIKKRRRRNRNIVPILAIILSVLYAVQSKINLFFIHLTIGICWFYIYPLWEKNLYVRYYRKFINENYKERLGRNTLIEIHNDFIFANDLGSESRILTSEIKEITEIPDYCFIRLKTGQSFIIPIYRIHDSDKLFTRLKDLASYLKINYRKAMDWKWK